MKRQLATFGVGLLATAALVSAGTMTSAPARAVDGNIAYGLEFGNVDRASFSEHANAQGYRINSYGSSPCSAITTDKDLSIWGVRADWSDQVSWVSDWNQCDTALFKDVHFGRPISPFSPPTINYGGGRNLGWGENDEMTSFYLS